MKDMDLVRKEFHNLDDASDKVVDSLTRLEQTLAQQQQSQANTMQPRALSAKPVAATKTQTPPPTIASKPKDDEWGEF